MFLPCKPHFFKPLLPGFEDEFLIPVSFLFKYLKGQDCKKAVLRSCSGKLWPIKVNGRRFEDGWKEFTRHHELHVGDFLVFRHEGDMVFHVKVFDPSNCERKYPLFSIKKEGEHIGVPKEESPKKKSSPEKSRKKKQCAKASASVPDCPYFEAKLTSYSAKQSRLPIPMIFATLQGLSNKRREMIVIDQEGRSWPTMLWYKSSDGKVFIGSGWTNCRVANDLKEGDSLRFELIKNGKRPLFRMSRLQANPKAKRDLNSDDAQADSSSTRHLNVNATSRASYTTNSQLKIPKEEEAKESQSGEAKRKGQPTTFSKAKAYPSATPHTCFVAKMSSGMESLHKMHVPMKFARLHHLDNRCCKMILIDQERRAWPAKLWYKKTDGQVYIRDGWRAFCIANDLKPRDSLIFELIGNGKKPVLKMQGLDTNPKAEKGQAHSVKQAGSSSTQYPHFIVTMRASYFKNSQMRIPTKFAKRYNLDRTGANLTLIDERGSSWPVSLRIKQCDIYIARGLGAFIAANGVKEGEAYKLELIKEGENPVLKIYGLQKGTRRNEKYDIKRKQKGILEDCEDVKPIIECTNVVASRTSLLSL